MGRNLIVAICRVLYKVLIATGLEVRALYIAHASVAVHRMCQKLV